MNKVEFIEKLTALLLTIPSAGLSHGGREINLRCRECPDSMNPKSKHMFINLGMDDTPLYYHCFKCGCRGIITIDRLIIWGLYNASQELFVNLVNYNKSVLTLDKNKMFRDLPIYKLHNNYVTDNALSRKKLEYINKRLGVEFTYDDLFLNKIVLNLKDLLKSNNITQYSRRESIIDELDESFIGFISEDNCFITCRNLRRGKVNKSIDSKYTTYNIFNKFETMRRHYTIPTDIDLLSNKIKLNIGEGSFDVLSALYNVNKERFNNIYCAIGGNGYINIIKYFLISRGFMNLEVHIYIDNDVEDYKVYNILTVCKDFKLPLYIHRNMFEGQKDFGVKSELIINQVQRLN